MKVGRLMLLGLAGWLASSTLVLGSPQRPISKSAFMDWSAHTRQIGLRDGSVLSEYFAQTNSGSLEDNHMQVSFIPRFGCKPVISFIVASYLTSGTASPPEIVLEIDDRSAPFPALIDQEDASFRYTFNASSAQQSVLLRLIDAGSRIKVTFTGARSASADASVSVVSRDVSVNFSLLGSKMSAQVASEKCEVHTPIPFEAN